MAAANLDDFVPADEPVIQFTRLLDAPRTLVWEAFTDPNHLLHWWGGEGVSITTHSHDFRTGGVWDFVMHDPSGTDYDNKITYETIEKPARLVYRHGSPGDPDLFRVTITLTPEGGKTRLVMHSRFPNVAIRDQLAREVGAVERGSLHLKRLAEYLRQKQNEQ